MEMLQSVPVQCPYCGEELAVAIDCSIEDQSYIEDCQVCCRPIVLHAIVEDEVARVTAVSENE